jgi:hypothetical protein
VFAHRGEDHIILDDPIPEKLSYIFIFLFINIYEQLDLLLKLEKNN